MTSHHLSSLPNSPNYYWQQANSCFDQWIMSDKMKQIFHDECLMYLFLYEMSTTGEF